MSDSRVLQRVVFPQGDNLDIVPLYVDADPTHTPPPLTTTTDADPAPAAAIGVAQHSVTFGSALAGSELDSRRAARIRAGRRVSFATYFNAFPASYWRRWTDLDSVTLRLRISGRASVVVYRSNARGNSHPVDTISVPDEEVSTLERSLPLHQFIDGGWYWFDIVAGPNDVVLLDAEWVARTERTTPGRLTIGITTYNRPEFCLEQLRALGRAEDTLAVVDAIVVVDQGTDRIQAHPDFAAAATQVADLLEVVEQPNLGGSGGFSRVMDETLRAGRSDYVLLLDDDIVGEPESIVRAATFADLARRPMLVGGHMFSLHDRSVLHSFGETVTRYSWWWGTAPHTRARHDFGRAGLRQTPWLHRRVDVDYNGWWMCLIPMTAVRDIGLAMPAFLKWDDAEYGLRAGRAGYPTVSLPGVAVWHVPWDDKTDALDWQAYYHLRNRVLAALLHSPFPRGGKLLSESLQTQLAHLLAMQYSTATLRLRALEDLLEGPDHLHRELATTPAVLRAVRASFPDAAARTSLESFPPVRRAKPRRTDRVRRPPRGRLDLAGKVAANMTRQLLTPVHDRARRHPQDALSHQDAQWWSLAGADSAIVSAADGSSAAWYLRDPDRLRELMRRSVVLHARLAREWPALAERYRAAAPHFTSPERWRGTFRGELPGR